jgi:GT2 family glycosyltransferase
MNISLLVGLKNNLDYSQNFYHSTRHLYPNVELCFVSYGSTDRTHEWLDSLNDPNLKYFYSNEQKTFSDTFNKAAELSTKDYVAYLHNDIVLAPGFIEDLIKHQGENNIVSYTTIEPPIFTDHERPGKIIWDFGSDFNDFNNDEFLEFVKENKNYYKDQTAPGVTFFMMMPKKVLLDIGGMDNIFNPMFCEDDDLVLRFKLLGMNLFTSLDAMCYHFVSKTSRFSDEYKDRTKQIEQSSIRNYVRKWGNRDESPKYDIGFILHNANLNILGGVEPWCSNIYITDENLKNEYISYEKTKTKFDLNQRIKIINKDTIINNIIVEFDGTQINNDNFLLLQKLSNVIKESGDIGIFELDIFKIIIRDMTDYQNTLINIY